MVELLIALAFPVLIGTAFWYFVRSIPFRVFSATSPFQQMAMDSQAKSDARAEEGLQLTHENDALLQEIRDLLKSSQEA
jgi:large-conductance mechanosensitive channel